MTPVRRDLPGDVVLWVLCAAPASLACNLWVLACRARATLGHWPEYTTRAPKKLGFAFGHGLCSFWLCASVLSILVGPILWRLRKAVRVTNDPELLKVWCLGVGLLVLSGRWLSWFLD